MMIYVKYFWHVVKHKWFVLIEGIKVGASLWRLLKHDLSKFLPDEFFPYAVKYYKKEKKQTEQDKYRYNRAWVRHFHRNDHHWQYWIIPNGLKDGTTFHQTLEMSEESILELIADWRGFSRSRGMDAQGFYVANHRKIYFHPRTRTKVEELLNLTEKQKFIIDQERPELGPLDNAT